MMSCTCRNKYLRQLCVGAQGSGCREVSRCVLDVSGSRREGKRFDFSHGEFLLCLSTSLW